jgi:hypothetical protein
LINTVNAASSIITAMAIGQVPGPGTPFFEDGNCIDIIMTKIENTENASPVTILAFFIINFLLKIRHPILQMPYIFDK